MTDDSLKHIKDEIIPVIGLRLKRDMWYSLKNYMEITRIKSRSEAIKNIISAYISSQGYLNYQRMFVPCPKCKNRMYEYDTATIDDDGGKYLFNFKCDKCSNIYNDALNLNRDTHSDKNHEFLKAIMNPETIAKIAKKTMEKM